MIMKRTLCLIAVFIVITVFPAVADSGTSISGFKLLTLQPGVNEIPHLVSDGRDGVIIKTWRTNGNAHGYNLFLVMVEGKVVGVSTDHGFDDVIKDDPHTIEDAIRSIRFARGNVGSQKAVLLITATRDIKPDASPADPATVVFDIYQLAANGNLGTTGDFFERISESHSDKKYCNSDLALSQKFGFPLPDPYEGQNQVDGCL